ncbi:MAG: hypothetical protein NZL83_01055 [Candidatus Absconditabacterales bacterium]|nr:hypothetical protein [Candidatus Absconditabacterales bacterium]
MELEALAKTYNLLSTGGSDFHDYYIGKQEMIQLGFANHDRKISPEVATMIIEKSKSYQKA